jgi:phage tail-like protein
MPTDPGTLIVQLEGSVVQTLQLTMEVLTIGRLPDSGLVLPHARVSRRHAELRVGAEGPVLTDLGSSNGTFVGGERLRADQPHPLADGASVEIGPFLLTYQSAVGRRQSAEVRRQKAEGMPKGHPQEAGGGSQEAEGGGQGAGRGERSGESRGDGEPGEGEEWGGAAGSREQADLPAPVSPSPNGQRSTRALSLAVGPQSRYLLDLPVLFHDNEFLGRYLLILESIWEPLEQRQDHIDQYFNPATCPASFLPWLARWLDVSFNAHWPEARRRHLLAEAMDLYRWRGTRYGLERMIEVCTGLTPEITEDPAQPFVFRVRVTIPAGSGIERDLIEELVRAHKPAHAGYVLEVKG